MAIWTLILSIIGALAWVPIVIEYIKIKNRKIQGSIVDFFCIYDTKLTSYDGKESKSGTLVLLLMNFFVAKESVYVNSIDATVTLTSGTTASVELIDGRITVDDDSNNPIEEVCIPDDMNLNLHREIIAEKDNIRIVPLLLINTTISNFDEIDCFSLKFNKSKQSKNVIIKREQFPKFNKNSILRKYFENIRIF